MKHRSVTVWLCTFKRQLQWILHSLAFIFFWPWLPRADGLKKAQTMTRWKKKKVENHSIPSWNALVLLSPELTEENGKTQKGKGRGEFWHPKPWNCYKPTVAFSAQLCWNVIIIRISCSLLAFLLSQHLISKYYYSLSPFQPISTLPLS